MSSEIYFDGWPGVLRVVAIGVPAYLALVFILRLSGKRSLAQLNIFDLVVTVSLGSTLATILLSNSVALAEGVTALALLIFLQFVLSWSSVRSAKVRNAIRSEPTLLYHDNNFVGSALKKQRVSREEILQAVRSSGLPAMDKVGSVILETDGSFSVIPLSEGNPETLLSNVSRAESDAEENE